MDADSLDRGQTQSRIEPSADVLQRFGTCEEVVLFAPPGALDVPSLLRRAGLTANPPRVLVVRRRPEGELEVLALRNGVPVGGWRRAGTADDGDAPGRETPSAPSPLRTADGRVEIDVAARLVFVEGRRVPMPRREFDLLVHLMTRPGRTVSRRELLRQVWGYADGNTATVTVHMRQLRCKLEANPGTPVHLITVRGVGYRFDP